MSIQDLSEAVQHVLGFSAEESWQVASRLDVLGVTCGAEVIVSASEHAAVLFAPQGIQVSIVSAQSWTETEVGPVGFGEDIEMDPAQLASAYIWLASIDALNPDAPPSSLVVRTMIDQFYQGGLSAFCRDHA